MMTKPQFCLLFAILALLAPVGRAADKESLYNAKTAQKLGLSKLSHFGPQASKFKYDARMVRAAEIAAARARSRSTSRTCIQT